MTSTTSPPGSALVGRPVGSGPSVAPDPVNQPMIRHWAAAFEDANAVYTDRAPGSATSITRSPVGIDDPAHEVAPNAGSGAGQGAKSEHDTRG